jgi:hypothetical protein
MPVAFLAPQPSMKSSFMMMLFLFSLLALVENQRPILDSQQCKGMLFEPILKN